MWRPPDAPWQYRVLDALPPGIDVAQLERTFRLTPAERFAELEALMELADELQRAMSNHRRREPRPDEELSR